MACCTAASCHRVWAFRWARLLRLKSLRLKPTAAVSRLSGQTSRYKSRDMASTTAQAEFVMANRFVGDHRGPVRWIFSHAIHHWLLWLLMFGGALGNAALAAVMPFLIGEALN